MFKFVLTKDNDLFIGFDYDYHADIAPVRGSDVKAAGHLRYDNGWVLYGESIGFDISFSEDDEEVVLKILGTIDKAGIITSLDENYRVCLKSSD